MAQALLSYLVPGDEDANSPQRAMSKVCHIEKNQLNVKLHTLQKLSQKSSYNTTGRTD